MTGRSLLDHARILLAEGDPAVRAGLSGALSSAGYDVELVATAETLCQVASGLRLPALIVAGPCPCMSDAMRVLEYLRRHEIAAPFLLLVAFPDDELRDAAFRLGARTFERPFRPIEFCSYVRCLVPLTEPTRPWRGRPRIDRRSADAEAAGGQTGGCHEAPQRKNLTAQSA